MAYTLSTKQVIGRGNGTTAVLVPSFEAAAGVGAGNGNYFDNTGGRKFIWIDNASGSLLTVTIKINPARTPIDGIVVPDATFTVAAGTQGLFGEVLTSLYEQTQGALSKAILIEWDAVTTITFAIIELPQGVEGG